MKVMVIGKGGREHALVKALGKSQSVERVYAIPGNQGMDGVECFNDSVTDVQSVVKRCKSLSVDLVVVGPEDPLAAGISDDLRESGLLVFGPDKKGAELEASKICSKEFMDRHGVPTAPYQKVSSVEDVLSVVDQFTPPYVLKADGLAAGKGVFICKNKEELLKNSKDIFENNVLGDSGKKAIVEQFQPGFELSFFVLTNGSEYVSLPMAQDHKKLNENDEGPNTGGMGTVAPMEISSDLYQEIIDKVVKTTVSGLEKEGFVYRGVVFIGIMVTENGPQVLEYNVRFGDPETQVLLPLLDGDWGQAFKTIAEGNIPKLQWKKQSAACVVIAAEKYPSTPVKGVTIKGDLSSTSDEAYFLHAGTLKEGNEWKTAGGRVLNAVGLGTSIEEALSVAYDKVKKVEWPGMQFRKDIGKKALKL